MCMERLGYMIKDAVDKGDWEPITLSRNGPKLSHLFFVDDAFLFTKAKLSQMRVMPKILH